MSANLVPSPFMQFFTAGGVPLVGGKLYTYLAGTTTPLATYTNASGSTPNTNPVILDSRGEAAVWVGPSAYKFKLCDANNVEIWTADNIGDNYDSSSIVYAPAGTGAVSTTVQAKLRQSVSVFDFLTSAQITDVQANTAAVDVTAGFQAAINYAQTSGYALYIPAGTYKTTSTLTITKRLHLFGDGAKISLISSSALEALVVSTAVGYGNTFSYFHDFGIDPSVAGGGTSGFVCRLAAAGASYSYMSNFVIERVYVGDFSSYGMVFDNSVANGNGFFTFTVRRCWISNGLNLNKIGDSCNIEENTITDGATVRTNHSGGRVGVLYTGLSGARQVVLRSNNITTSGGAIAVISGEQVRIQDNQCEHPFYYQIPYGASGPYNAFIYLYNCPSPEIVGNTIQPGASDTKVTTGNTHTSGVIDNIASMTNIYVGCTIAGSGISPGTRVTSVGPGSQVGISIVTSSTLTGTALTFGYAADYAVAVSGTTSYGEFAGNDVFLGALYHLGFSGGAGIPAMFLGEANTFQGATNVLIPVVNNPTGNINAKMLPHVTTSTLPAAGSFPGGLVWDETAVAAKISNGTTWSALPVAGSGAPSMTSLFFNPFFDIYGNNSPAVGPPLGVTAAGSAIRETVLVYPGSSGSTSMQVISFGATITNGVVITPGIQPWRDSTESVAISIAIRSLNTTNVARVYLFDGTTYWPMGQSTVGNTWELIQGSHTLLAGSNWSVVVAGWQTTTSTFTNGVTFYVGGLTVVRGTVAANTIDDNVSRRNYVIQETVAPLYAPAFSGMRYVNNTTAKIYMAAGSSVVGDWYLLN